MAQNTGVLSAPGDTVQVVPGGLDSSALLIMSGVYTGAVVAFETSRDGSMWVPAVASRRDSIAAPAVQFTASTNGIHAWMINTKGMIMVRARLTAISSGSVQAFLSSNDDPISYPSILNQPDGGTVSNLAQIATNTTPAGAPLMFDLRSASGINATSVKGSSTTIYNIVVTNTNNLLARYLKLYNKATAPVPASDVPKIIVPILGGATMVQMNFGAPGLVFPAGLSFLLTSGTGDTDALGVGAGDIYLGIGYR